MSDEHKEDLIKEFQCPGCVCGINPGECEKFEFLELDGHVRCEGHVAGTRLMGVRSSLMCIGLPKGFNRVAGHKDKSEPHMRMFPKGVVPDWNKFNVATWAMEKDGFLFVRTFMPRVDITVVDVVEGGTMDMVPGAVDVGEFVDEID
jgi:hypothetical protein